MIADMLPVRPCAPHRVPRWVSSRQSATVRTSTGSRFARECTAPSPGSPLFCFSGVPPVHRIHTTQLGMQTLLWILYRRCSSSDLDCSPLGAPAGPSPRLSLGCLLAVSWPHRLFPRTLTEQRTALPCIVRAWVPRHANSSEWDPARSLEITYTSASTVYMKRPWRLLGSCIHVSVCIFGSQQELSR